jgi:hypothetical protein
MEHAYSWAAAAHRLLWEAMAMVGQDILHPIWVSLRRRKGLPEFLWFPPGSLTTPSVCFCVAFGLRHS